MGGAATGGSCDSNLPPSGNGATPGHGRPRSPTEVAKGASGEELLQRLRLADTRPQKTDVSDFDPRIAHPNLNLSGHIISATFCVPYKVAYAPGADWELTPRRGTSALFDSFSYLASPESSWGHTLVGWTGEIDRAVSKAPNAAEEEGGGRGSSSFQSNPVNRDAAPIPISPNQRQALPPQDQVLRIPRADRERLEKQLERNHGGRLAPVWLVDEVDEDDVVTLRNQRKWRRYGEHELFKLFHYKMNEPADGRGLNKAWANYYRMNKAFADTIMGIYKPGDIVLVHDYHLMLLPSMLRQRIATIYIGFFLHIPFPSSEYYRCLTRRKEILESVLGANMVGFQAYSYSRHFSSCCTRILGFDSSPAGVDSFGAHVAVDVFPIGIDVDNTIRSAFGPAGVERAVQELRRKFDGMKVIVGRDRLDPVRGVAQKLQAFEMFLERHPKWHGKVVLIQVTSPTSIEDHEDKDDKQANKISDLVARINGSFGSLSYSPIQYYSQYIDKDEYFALLRVADLGLITSVRDGMNTTALEFVLAQRDNHSPLIISEFSGTASSLGTAFTVNPWDLSAVADSIDLALDMTEDQKASVHRTLYDRVTHNTVQTWTSDLLKRLLTNLSSFDQSSATPALDRARLLEQYHRSQRRLFMFDYDGTLTPIVKDPQSAIPSDRTIRTLKTLASDPANAVWIISGRDQAFLEEWMGHISELGLSAEHGSFIRQPHGAAWENLTETIDMGWQTPVMAIFQHYAERTPGAFLERKKIALTWHYRRADPEHGARMARECQKHLEQTVARQYDVEVMVGKANLEVRPRFVNKGEIAKTLLRSTWPDGKGPDFVLCLGDDFTDEDMFRALNASHLPREAVFAVTVGPSSKQTLARWHLLEPADVLSTVALLNGQSDAGPNAGVLGDAASTSPESRL